MQLNVSKTENGLFLLMIGTGIQATERLEKNLPMRPGKVETRVRYVHHGTQTLIANFDVATGTIIKPNCGDSRTESDFLLNISRIIEESDRP